MGISGLISTIRNGIRLTAVVALVAAGQAFAQADPPDAVPPSSNVIQPADTPTRLLQIELSYHADADATAVELHVRKVGWPDPLRSVRRV